MIEPDETERGEIRYWVFSKMSSLTSQTSAEYDADGRFRAIQRWLQCPMSMCQSIGTRDAR
jgi:hypothetical protein